MKEKRIEAVRHLVQAMQAAVNEAYTGDNPEAVHSVLVVAVHNNKSYTVAGCTNSQFQGNVADSDENVAMAMYLAAIKMGVTEGIRLSVAFDSLASTLSDAADSREQGGIAEA